ncbi:chloroplastic outer envelope membrane protein homolog [Chondrocystis sp. NIES-4102]|nr:chloroplastic outer envelope membrane protein homolog [Chondrocystis sp. NIES-4102]
MLIESKNVRLSPTFITILATVLTLGVSLPTRAENPNLVATDKVLIANGAAILKNIKPNQIAQNPDTPPSNSPPKEEQPKGAENSTPPKEAEPRVLVAEVVVEGASEELKDIVYATIGTEPGRTTTRSQLQEDVNAIYATGYFQNVEVSPGDTPLGVRVTFLVEANPILKEVTIETIPQGGASEVLPPDKVTEIFGKNYGQILNLRQLQQGIIKINDWYSKNGYELAQVVGSPQVSPDGKVTLVIAEGIVEDIKVRYFDENDEPTKGKTREFIVKREVELQPGDVFKRDTAQKDLQRVFGLGIFEDARFSFSPGTDPSKVIVNIDVVEGSTGSVAAGAGYSSASGLFGTVSYQQKNFGGNNQTLGTEVQIGDDSLLFDVNFTDPWIGTSESRTSYTVNAFRRRSTSLVFNGDEDINTDNKGDAPRIVRTGGGVNFSRPIPSDPFKRREWTLSTGLQYQRVEVKDSDGDIAPLSQDPTPDDGIDNRQNLAFSDSGKDDLFTVRFGATRDRRNNALQPTKGSILRLGTEQTIPLGSGNILFNRLRANYSQYVPVNLIRFSDGPESLAFNVQAGTILGDVPPYEAFILGGSNSIRGYGDGEVGSGKSYLQATAEYRFPIFRIVGGALFFDYGTTLGSEGDVPGQPSVVRDLPNSGYGYGLGVRIQSPLGPIRVDYAFNDEGGNEIQFGIGEKF